MRQILFIKDQIEMEELKVKSHPTGNILSGHFTNPLQGLPSVNSEPRYRESWRTPEIQTWYGKDPRGRSFPSHRSVLRINMEEEC